MILTSKQALLFTAPAFQIAVLLNQLSILFLYRRVFTMKKKWFRWSIYGIGLFCIATGLAIFFAGLFHCVPIEFGWDPNVKGGVCYVSVRELYITANLLNLFGDLGIVILPIPLIWSLHMNKKTKAAVSGMFLLGGLSVFPISAIQHAASPLIAFLHSVTIINLIKLNSILVIKRTDFTCLGPTLTLVPCRPHAFANLTLLFSGTNVPIAIWTHAEICLGIVSACLPCYRPLFRSIGEAFSTNRSGKGSGAAGALQQRSGHKSGSHGTDAYNSLGEGKDQGGDIISGSNVALVPSDQWSVPSLPGHEGKVKSMAEGKPLREDVELGMNRNAIGVTRDVDVSSVKAG